MSDNHTDRWGEQHIDKVRMFTSDIEDEAREQVKQTASLPFVRGLAVMPDVHWGKGSTVGTVVATRKAIMPACVGVDIGCGMIAVRTTLRPEQVRPHLKAIREGIERRIPLGIGPHGMNSYVLPSAEEAIKFLEVRAYKEWGDVNYMNQRAKDWRLQIGSLGGGNHFIEICTGEALTEWSPGRHDVNPDVHTEQEVWVILHSGSRGVGNKTGQFWTNKALSIAKKYMYDSALPNPDLAYLVEESEEFWQYMKELHWCQEYARLNREEMMDRVLTELTYALGTPCGTDYCGTVFPITYDIKDIEVERINCHHNFTQKEQHGGESVWITRKGAIEAKVGMRALIPGSMGTPSYIVTGLGCEGAYNSAPHGAGRRMSRGKARKTFTLEQVQKQMDDAGIEARVRPEILDEAPGAYKDIEQVIADAVKLVEPTHILRQLISVKGD